VTDIFIPQHVSNFTFHIEHDKDEGTLQSIEDNEWVPQKLHTRESCYKSEYPGEAHDDEQLQVQVEENLVFPVQQ